MHFSVIQFWVAAGTNTDGFLKNAAQFMLSHGRAYYNTFHTRRGKVVFVQAVS